MGFSPQNLNFPSKQGPHPSNIYCQNPIFVFLYSLTNFLSTSASCYFSNLLWLFILFIFVGTRKWVTTLLILNAFIISVRVDRATKHYKIWHLKGTYVLIFKIIGTYIVKYITVKVKLKREHCLELRIIRRLNLIVSQPFLYIWVGQYTIVKVEITT